MGAGQGSAGRCGGGGGGGGGGGAGGGVSARTSPALPPPPHADMMQADRRQKASADSIDWVGAWSFMRFSLMRNNPAPCRGAGV